MTGDQYQKKIRELKQQIKLHKEQNQVLVQYVEDMKVSRNQTQHQLEMSQEREKLAFLREKKDFQRILELEKKLKLLAPPESPDIASHTTQEVDLTDDENQQPEAEKAEFTDEVDEEIDYNSKEMQRLVDRALRRMVKQQQPVESPPQALPVFEEQTEQQAPEDIEEPPPVSKMSLENEEVIEENQTDAADPVQPQVPKQPDPVKETTPPQETIVTAKTSIGAETSIKAETQKQVPETIPETKEEVSSEKQNYLINEYFNRGLAAANDKNFSVAIEAFTKVTTLLPHAAPSYLNLAILHFRTGSYEEALHFCQEAIQRGSQPAKQLLPKIQKEIDKN